MVYITRTQSGLSGPLDGISVPAREKTKFVTHWDGGENPDTEEDELRLLRAYIRHHFNQGWRGPAYNLAVGPITGNVYELRGLAAVGTHAPGANRDGIGCILIGGPGNLTEAGKRGLRAAYALASSFAGRQLQQLVHSDVVATACPGDELRAWVHGGGLSTPSSNDGQTVTSNKENIMLIGIQGAAGKRRGGTYELRTDGTARFIGDKLLPGVPLVTDNAQIAMLQRSYKGLA